MSSEKRTGGGQEEASKAETEAATPLEDEALETAAGGTSPAPPPPPPAPKPKPKPSGNVVAGNYIGTD